MLSKLLPESLHPTSASPALVDEFQPERLIPSAIAGGITGMIGIIRAISYAALIFSGPLANDLNIGVGMAVLSSALISVVVALTSSLAGMIATPLAAPTLVLTVLAASIAQQLSPTMPQTVIPTVIAAIALGSMLTGLVLWLLGQLKWGQAMEFLPYPVVGGFMAGTGLLLVRGAMKVMTNHDLTFVNLAWLIQRNHAPQWLAGLAIATLLLWATRQFHHYLVMPSVLLLATLAFYGTIWGYHLPLSTVRAEGWLLGPFPQGDLWHPLTLESIAQVQWGSIAQASPTLGLLIFVSLLSLVLTNGSLELAVEKDLDLNRELKAVGLANLVAGFGSSMAGNQALPSTLLVHRLGAANRLTGVFKAVPCFTVLILGPTFLNYFPKPILGSLLLFLGIDLLWQWLYKAWFKLPWVDYLIILVTLGVINTAGFIPGIGIGLAIAAGQFLIQCSRLDTISVGGLAVDSPSDTAEATPPSITAKNLLEASIHSAGKTSDDTLPKSLVERQHGVDCVHLKGLLFFGTAKGVCQKLCDRILHAPPAATPLQYLILDFQSVLAMDSSAAMSLSKLAKLAHKHDCTLIFCGLSQPRKEQLLKSQTLDLDASHCFLDWASALKWCSSQVQKDTVVSSDSAESSLIEGKTGDVTNNIQDALQPALQTSLELTELSP